jgi:hypothetical protein
MFLVHSFSSFFIFVAVQILVGTDTGEILVFEQAEFRGQLESSPREGKSIDSIAAFSKGYAPPLFLSNPHDLR